MPRISIKLLRRSSLSSIIDGSAADFKSKEENGSLLADLSKKRKRGKGTDDTSKIDEIPSNKKVGLQKISSDTKKYTALQSKNPVVAAAIAEKQKVELTGANDFNNDRTVYIEGLPFNSTEEEVSKFFAPCGKIIQIRLPKFQDSARLLGYGHILFSSATGAKKAIEMDGSYIQNRYIKVQLPMTPKILQHEVNTSKIVKPPGCRTVFVKNIPYDCTEDDIIECLRVCGPISKVRLAVWGHTKQLKGFAYVEFKREESAEIAVKKSAALSIKGRKLFIDFETGAPKASYKPSIKENTKS